ncbi:TM2 domain-containing protein [Streptomyces iconiensis]|uniref:TM2 domain-containing protein n=1 Tax=Streptomyces iconiensis TaxID=1384038 RepID=A0ABT6ZS75_9ACTN|nr:TM2 domain-containing protein [Streptomyces iconiensis]MDJ1131913.1 TM2 domain-containing protein [Streptomyces iconiensis]
MSEAQHQVPLDLGGLVSNPNQPGYGYPQEPGQNPYSAPGPGQPPPPGPGQAAYGYPHQAPPMGGGPGQYGADPNAPYGYDPYGRPYSNKSKIVAGVLQLFLGGLGIGRFYTGHIGMGIAQLLTCGGLGVWSLIDGIIFLVSDQRTDSDGRILRS